MNVFPHFFSSIAKKMGLFYTNNIKFIFMGVSMNDLTLDKFEKSYLNSSIITDE